MSENTESVEVIFDPNSVTANINRDTLLSAAILKLHNQDANDPSLLLLPSVQMELPNDFDLDALELKKMLDHMGLAPVAEPTEPAQEVPEFSREQVTDRIAELGREIAQTRADVVSLGQAQRYARDVLAKAIQAFAAGSFIQPTREQCVKEVGDTLRAVREGRIPSAPRPTRAQGSVIDRMNGLDGGPGAADRFARKQMSRGYKRFARGDVYGRLSDGPNGQPRYGIKKLPSEL
jgi:hypothetical protein